MESLACSWSFEIGSVAPFAQLKQGKAAFEIFEGIEASR